MKKIGFYGGTFGPIHFGHLNLAIHMLEEGGLDEILFCPAFHSPFKAPEMDAHHRFEMLKAVLADIPGLSLTSIEIDRRGAFQGPSYTVDTLRALQKPGVQYRLILSEESAERFFEWKEPEEILRLAPPIIGSRDRGVVPASLQANVIQTPLFDISSTEVRERLKKKMVCNHLIPGKALDYIYRHGLYS